MSFSQFFRILSYGHGILCRRCKQSLCDHELEYYFSDVCVSIRAHRVNHYNMCLPHFKNVGGTRQSLLQREFLECQQVERHPSHVTRHTSRVTRHQGFTYCHGTLMSRIQEFRSVVVSDSIIKMLNAITRKLDKMHALLSEFLHHQFLRGEVCRCFCLSESCESQF